MSEKLASGSLDCKTARAEVRCWVALSGWTWWSGWLAIGWQVLSSKEARCRYEWRGGWQDQGAFLPEPFLA